MDRYRLAARKWLSVTVRPKRGTDQLEKQATRPPLQQLDLDIIDIEFTVVTVFCNSVILSGYSCREQSHCQWQRHCPHWELRSGCVQCRKSKWTSMAAPILMVSVDVKQMSFTKEWRLERGYRPKKTGETVDRRNNGSVKAVSPHHCGAATSQHYRNCCFNCRAGQSHWQGQYPAVALLLKNNPKRKKSNFRSPAPPPYSWSLLG